MQEIEDKQNSDSNFDSCTNTEMPIFICHLHYGASSNNNTSDGSYVDCVYEQQGGTCANNDNSSINGSDG